MLVLTRKEDQAFLITVPPSNVEQQIVVVVQSIKGNSSKIAIGAERKVRIVRDDALNTKEQKHVEQTISALKTLHTRPAK